MRIASVLKSRRSSSSAHRNENLLTRPLGTRQVQTPITASRSENCEKSILDTLNFDVFYNIVRLLSRQDLLCLMRTCQAMHIECTQALLSSDIELKNPPSTSKFCAYILRDTDTRGPLLRSISVSHDWNHILHRSDLEPLCTVLKHAHNLRKFAILHAQILISLGPDAVTKVLSDLASLEVLEIQSAQLLQHAVLRSMRCTLTQLILNWDMQTPWHIDTTALHAWAPSLQVLHLTCMFPSPSTPISFPSLRDLSFDHPATISDIIALLHVCPSLRALRFKTHAVSSSDAARQRQKFATAHAQMRWPALSHISADLTGLYQTALKQPMRRVDVVLDVIERHTVAWLTTVLTDMQPTHLQLQMDTSIERVQAFVPELLQAATRVKCFRLMVRSQYGIATSKIVSLLRPLSITELEIVDLSGHSLAYRPESLALSAASAVQSLEFVSVSISDRTQSFLITRSRIHGDITAELLDDMSSRSRREKNWS